MLARRLAVSLNVVLHRVKSDKWSFAPSRYPATVTNALPVPLREAAIKLEDSFVG
jgi:hypothetical protein